MKEDDNMSINTKIQCDKVVILHKSNYKYLSELKQSISKFFFLFLFVVWVLKIHLHSFQKINKNSQETNEREELWELVLLNINHITKPQ